MQAWQTVHETAKSLLANETFQKVFWTGCKGVLFVSAGLVISILAEVGLLLVRPYTSPLRYIPGPRHTGSILIGHVKEIVDGNGYPVLKGLYNKYGHIFVFRAWFRTFRCIPVDNKAVYHILNRHDIYQKPEQARYNLAAIIGNGLISAEGAEHKLQRKVMTPAFSAAHLRGMLPTFLNKSTELRDVWNEQIAAESKTSQKEPSTRVDVLHWLSRATLDIIGLSGFNYDFNTLRTGEEGNELASAFHKMNNPGGLPVLMFMKGLFKALRLITWDAHSRSIRHAHSVARSIGLQLIHEKVQRITEEKANGGREEKGKEKDLLSLMIKSNLSTATPVDQRLSTEQILGQIPTFLEAGHETTSTAVSWTLFALSQNLEAQARLREELLEAFPLQPTPEQDADEAYHPSIEALNGLPYLDAVVKEGLRWHPPVENTAKMATCDDIIPLDKPYRRVDGKMSDHIEVKKGDIFIVAITVMNRLKETWGEDAEKFNPDRWMNPLPPAVSKVPGAYANILTFINGHHACIGFRFAVLEMKAILFYLIRSFEFELAVPADEIIPREMIVSRPMVRSQLNKGAQMPMIIRPVKPTY